MNLGGAQVEPELNRTRLGNGGQRRGAEGEGAVAVLRSGARPGPHPISMKEKVTPGKFQKGKRLAQLCGCLRAGLSLTQGRVASVCPQNGDFQRGSLPPCPPGALLTPLGPRASYQELRWVD